MILPFVRELLADLGTFSRFERVRRHLSGRHGAETCVRPHLHRPRPVSSRSSSAPPTRPALVLVADNKAAEALHATVLAACELTGALQADEVLRLPAHDVLPFENLSPHPEIQEKRAATLWKIASGHGAAGHRARRSRLHAAVPARPLRGARAARCARGEEYMPDMLVEHLLSVGYTRVDVVEMPGQVTLRGGILDVYGPEMERPVRIDFFGDEIESIRRFDPETQRSVSHRGRGAAAAAHRNARRPRSSARAPSMRGSRAAEPRARHSKAVRTRRTADARRTRNGAKPHLPRLGVLAPVAGAQSSLLDLLGAAHACLRRRAGDGEEPGRALVEQG